MEAAEASNIRVVARFRPCSPAEGLTQICVSKINDEKVEVDERGDRHNFVMDKIFLDVKSS